MRKERSSKEEKKQTEKRKELIKGCLKGQRSERKFDLCGKFSPPSGWDGNDRLLATLILRLCHNVVHRLLVIKVGAHLRLLFQLLKTQMKRQTELIDVLQLWQNKQSKWLPVEELDQDEAWGPDVQKDHLENLSTLVNQQQELFFLFCKCSLINSLLF